MPTGRATRMSAFLRSPFVSALLGGAVVAIAILALDRGGSEPATRTVLAPAPAGGGAATATRAASGAALTAREIYERDAPGVVFVRSGASGANAGGTGFVIDRDGRVLTTHQLVGAARSVHVRFGDDRTVPATVVGTDPRHDLALLRVDPDAVPLRPLELGDSGALRVGDPVLAIGNPFGLERTLTTGVVSALHRQLPGPSDFAISRVIQTDAPIDPGSAGGPLLDAAGRVVGVATRVAADAAGGGAGLGFAVPIDTVKRLLPELERTGGVSHAYLGITGVTIDAALAPLRLRARRGVLVQAVHAGSPAAKAGIRGGTVESEVAARRLQLGGDIITALDGEAIGSIEELIERIADRKPGDVVRLGIVRKGTARRVTVRLGRAPAQAPVDPRSP